MPNPYTTRTGTVTDVHGNPVRIGSDCDAVTIGGHVLALAVMDDFMRLAMQAEIEALAWAQAYGDEDELPGRAAMPGQVT